MHATTDSQTVNQAVEDGQTNAKRKKGQLSPPPPTPQLCGPGMKTVGERRTSFN